MGRGHPRGCPSDPHGGIEELPVLLQGEAVGHPRDVVADHPLHPVALDLPVEAGSWDRWPGDLARLLDRADVRASIVRQLRRHPSTQARISRTFSRWAR